MADVLQIIPGIGPSMAQDLRDLGVFKVNDLVGMDPELMYKRLCLIHHMHIDLVHYNQLLESFLHSH